ncbi:hypothetical protein BEWA_034100 [Theileria equi strain WA]|uniref:SWIM-type domain-containing protein n=1 Tax=Theileria equi strain WA TaxID=1537102 RepID=L0AZ75_THEEQ|nr:hypothetical protein BEWA_034100 [Theileria equi strain WA]AFZ80553.1 hypothetical protein BEWA_034100 [Theileria equi strain WA]|eukprot:XP_004830219.1 hypothetical protein BEWA_034100 [Theileria equi strain WA]
MDDRTAKSTHTRNSNKRFHNGETNSIPRDRDLMPFDFGPSGNGKNFKRYDHRSHHSSDNIRNTARRFAKRIAELGVDKSNFATNAQNSNESTSDKRPEYLEDGIWYGYLYGKPGFKKGLMISEMQDGVIECPEDYDTFQVYSNTSNYRIVDMSVCKCTCPNNKELCSHLIGVALFYRFKRNYIGKVAVFFSVEQYFKLSQRNLVSPESELDIVKNVIGHLNDTFKSRHNAGLYSISLELLVGILYRCYQKNNESLPSIVPLSKEDVTSLNKLDMDAESLVKEQTECGLNEVSNTTVKCSSYRDVFNIKDILYNLIHVVNKFCGEFEDSSKELVLNSLIRMLENRFSFKITNEAKLYISEIVDEYHETSSLKLDPMVSNIFYFTDVYSLCFDYIPASGGKKGVFLSNAKYSSQLDSATELIENAPLLLNLYDYTMWNYVYEDCLGPLPNFLLNEKIKFFGSYSFLYIHDRSVVKIKSPDCYISDLVIVQEITDGFDNFDAIKVLSAFITLLLKKRSMMHLPDFSLVKRTMDKKFEEKTQRMNDFLFLMFLLVPSPILLPFTKLFLLDSQILTANSINNFFSYFNSLYDQSLYRFYPFTKFISPFTCINNILKLSAEFGLDYITSVLTLLVPRIKNRQIECLTTEKRVVISEKIVSNLKDEEIMTEPDTRNYYAENASGRQLIEEIRVKEFGIGLVESNIDERLKSVLNKQRDRISRAVKRLSEDLYNSRTQLQLELIQNADDNCYSVNGATEPFISFFLDYESVVMLNNEDGFMEKDIRSICDIGSSSKVLKTGKTGKFGIGFKSVFILTSNPHIFSNGYSFMFSNDPSFKDNIEYILPHWVELSDSSPIDYVKYKLGSESRLPFTTYSNKILAKSRGKRLTLMYFPLKDEYITNEYYKKYYQIFQMLDLESILFLRNISTVHFYNNVDGVETLMNKKLMGTFLVDKSDCEIDIDNFKLVHLNLERKNIHSLDIVDSVHLEVLVVNYSFKLTAEESTMLSTSKAGNNSSLISIALPVSPEIPENTRYKLYNSLPIGEYGLNFMVNADFVLSANRQNLFTTDPWNEIIASKMCDVYVGIIEIIKYNYSKMSILYNGFVYSIPRQDDGISLFKYSCNRIFSKLLNIKWVLVDEVDEFVEPFKAIFVCSEFPDDFSNTEVMFSKLLRTVVPSNILRKHCDFCYINSILCRPNLKSKLMEYGIKIITFDLVVEIVSSILASVDINSGLYNQVQGITHILENMGTLIYLMSLLHDGQDLESLKSSLIFYSSTGEMFSFDSNIYYCINDFGLNDKQMKVISHSIFENTLNLENYEFMVTNFLKKLGCIEITAENYFKNLIFNKVTLLVDSFENNGYRDDCELFRQSFQIIKTLSNNNEACKNFDTDTISLIKRLPIKIESGGFTSLGNEYIKLCPKDVFHHSNGLNSKLYDHFMDIRSFYSHFDDKRINPLFISDDYFGDISANSILEFFGFIGVPTFIKYDAITVHIDTDLQIQVTSTTIDRSHEYFLKWKDEIIKTMGVFEDEEITDYTSDEFSNIVSILNLLSSENSEHSYFLSKLLFKIMERENGLYPHYLKSKVFVQGRCTDFAPSLFYFQLKFLPWIPYGQFIYMKDEASTVNSEDVLGTYDAKFKWKFTHLMSACDNISYHPLITKTLDPGIKGIPISDKGTDFTYVLEILTAICEQISNKYGLYGYNKTLYKHFSHESFDALTQLNTENSLSIILEIVKKIYSDLQKMVNDDSKYSEILKNAFDNKHLLVIKKEDELELTVTHPNNKFVSIYKTIDHPEFSYLSCIYGGNTEESGSLLKFWKTLGVSDYIGVEGSMAFLDLFIGDNQSFKRNIAQIFTTILNLYKITEKEMFLKLLYNRPIIPVVRNVSNAFKYFDCDDDKPFNTESVDILVPSDGLITIKTQESISAIKYFGSTPIPLVCKPIFSDVAFSKQSWIDVLDTLGAKDFISNCKIKVLNTDAYEDVNDIPLKLFVLVPILPYAHEYLKSNESSYYSTEFSDEYSWKNFEKTMTNLHIYTANREIDVYYEYKNGKDHWTSNKFSKKSVLYQASGKVNLLVHSNVKDISNGELISIRNLFSTGIKCKEIIDLINSSVGMYNSNLNLPLEFFMDISYLVFSNNEGDIQPNSENLSKAKFLSKFLCSVYKMVGKNPDEIQAFLSIFCSSENESCNCNVECSSNFSGYGVHLGKGINCDNNKLDPFTLATLRSIYFRVSSVPTENCNVNYIQSSSDITDAESCKVTLDSTDSPFRNRAYSPDFNRNESHSSEDAVFEHIDTTKFMLHEDRELATDQFVFENESSMNKRKSTGKVGEELVYEILKQIYEEEIELKTCNIHWHNKLEESGFPFDITIARPNQETYVEVKSSTSVTKTAFEISYNEWLFAQTKGVNYEIYRVSGVGTKDLKISRIINPYLQWKTGKLGFCLAL